MSSTAAAASTAVRSALATPPGPTATGTSTTAKSAAPLRQRFPDYTSQGEQPASDSDSYSSDDGEGETTAVDSSYAEDNYVRKVLAKEKPLPPITLKTLPQNIQVVSTLALTIVPALAIYGAFTTPLVAKTFAWAVAYYFYTGLGITAGYHRLWAHRSYTASKPLQYFLALGGSGAVEGSIKWWSRGHRAHHRYTDTELDPYSAQEGFWHAHLGWMLLKPRRKPGTADVSDLNNNSVIKWQHKYYLPLIVFMGFIFPTLVAGLGWGDYRGGFFFAGAARLAFVHHSTFCPKDHFITALVTIGEGYHNFHHEFPSDFRNAVKWYQYDPTKWFIFSMYKLGLASQLKTFPDNEIKAGQLATRINALAKLSDEIQWPKRSNDLPVLTWDQFQEEAKERQLIVVSGFIHDVSSFVDEHPGGRALIKTRLGKDATSAFYGGYYDHSNAAGNLLAQLRVGVIEGGYEVESLKKYSEVIESLKESGAYGCSGKQNDISTSVRKTVVIKGDPSRKTDHVNKLVDPPTLNENNLTGGLSQSFFF